MIKQARHPFLVAGVIALVFITLVGCATPIPEPPTLQPHGEENPPAQEPEPATTPETTKTTKIAFVRDCGTHYKTEIFIIDSDGSNELNITNNPGADLCPSWSPGGTQIVFQSYLSVCVMDADGQNLKCLSPRVEACKFPAWSPDGKTIAYSTSKLSSALDIFVMDANGNNKRPVSPISNRCLDCRPSSQVCPSWFPDSQRIAFLSNYAGWWEIYTVDIDGTDRKKYDVRIGVTYGIGSPYNVFPALAVSPDGASMAFDYYGKMSGRDIYILSLIDGSLTNLTEKLDGNSYFPTWSPDGTKVAFTLETDGKPDIYVIDADGSNPTLLVENGAYPAWQKGEAK